MASGVIKNKQNISGSISGANNTLYNANITTGGGVYDHERLINRESTDQHPTSAITGLDEILENKLDATTAMPLIDEAIKGKAKGLYFDAMKELARKSYWYLTSEIDPVTKQGTKESIISGPYDLGAGGGGGGGGVTTVTIKQVLWPTTVVAGGNTQITVNWSSVIGEDKTPTGNGTLYLSVNGRQVDVKANQAQGDVVFDLTKYIVAGSNTVQIRVLDAYGTTGITVGTINAVTLELKSSFDGNMSYTGVINYTYIPYGDVDKTVYFIIDGVKHGTQLVKSTGESQTYRIPALTHGAHSLEVYFTATIDGKVVTSNSLFYDLIYYVSGNETPIIASTFNKFEQEQYISFNIPYRVFIYNKNSFNVQLSVNGIKLQSLTVDNAVQYWEYRTDVPGNYSMQIACGDVKKEFQVHVNKSSINIQPITVDSVLALSAQGRNNSEDPEVRATWKDETNNINCELTNFNWSSNGWVRDDADENTVLRVSGDARVKIPYAPFAEDFKTRGKTIELEIATSTVRNYSTTIISCLDKSSTDTFTADTTLVDIDTRLKAFDVTIDITVIKEAGLTLGSHVFNYTALGWTLDGVVVDLTTYGITLTEKIQNIEGSGDNYVYVGDNIIIDYSLTARGFYVTPQVAMFRSQQSNLSTQYKEDEHVRLTFVIERNTANRIIWMYINGIASGACQYPVDDSFRQLDPDYIEIGSNDATVDIYNIRIYDNSLTGKQVVNNWIADTQNAALRAERYYRNDNYNDKNEIVISKLPSTTPYVVWAIDPLPQYKGDKRVGNMQYVEPLDSSRNFESENLTYNVQGTSSAVYPVKNIRAQFKQNEDFPNAKFSWYNDNGDNVEGFSITTPDGIPANYFTFKVDYASSEGANNVELVKLYNDASKEFGLFTPPQRQDAKIRVGIDGFPVVAFHQDTNGAVKFCTKANFNNDKANEDVYGFADGDESWEITNNSADEVKFKKPITKENFGNGFEIRFPDEDGYSNMDKLGPMTAWVASTYRAEATNQVFAEPVTFTYSETIKNEDGGFSQTTVTKTFEADTEEYRLTKFKAELSNWFNVDSTLFYYVYTLIYLMIDSRAKNAFPTYFASRAPGDGGDRWFWLPYDMDTAIGIDNKGKLSFDYYLEDFDQIDGADVYNGQDSVMWTNVRDAFSGEIAEVYARLRTQRLISFENTENVFAKHQAAWSENIFNEDSHNKYIVPLQNGDNYLEMLQGSKSQQRQWWLYNRFKYLDSKFNAGDAKEDFIQFRAYVAAGVEKPNITITPYADIYATVSYANGVNGTKSKRAKRNEPIIIENPFSIDEQETDQETYIYSASQLKSIGDISPFRPDTVKIGNATKLQELKIGDASPDYNNPYLSELTLGSNILLRTLDARNCTKLEQAIDVSKCTNIEEIYFSGTKITGITLPDGGSLRSLHLPETLTKLTIKNQPLLNDLQLAGTSNIESLWLENIPSTSIDAAALVAQMKANSAVRLIGIDETYTDWHNVETFYNTLDKMQGMDATGELIAKAQVTGKIYIDGTIPYAEFEAIKTKYPEVVITAKTVVCTIDFINEGVHFLSIQVAQGSAIGEVPDSEKLPTQSHTYAFDKWETTDGIVFYPELIATRNLEFDAYYTEHIRQYTITFNTDSTVISAEPNYVVADFGSNISAPTLINVPEGVSLIGWFRADGTAWVFEGPNATTIYEDETLTARWHDTDEPTLVAQRSSYNTIYFEATDNLGISGYAVTRSSSVPETWIPVDSKAHITETYEIDAAGEYTIWITDRNNNIISTNITAFEITYNIGEGVDFIELSEGIEVIDNFALAGTSVTISSEIDEHYKNLKLSVNDVPVQVGDTISITTNTTVTAVCDRRSYIVDFVTNRETITEPAQTIVYLNKVVKPISRYFAGYIIDSWYTDQNLTMLWDFDNDVVTGNMSLYAKWVEYKTPTNITVIITDELQRNFTLEEFESKLPSIHLTDIYHKFGAERILADFGKADPTLDELISRYQVSGIKSVYTESDIRALYTAEEYLALAHTVDVRYTQKRADLVQVNFGDDDSTSSSTVTTAVVSVVHTYAEAGTYIIQIYGGPYENQIGYQLGDGYAYQIVNPSKCIIDIDFAWDITTTADYALMHSSISELKLTEYMTTIAQGAFADCSKITTVSLPRSIVEIKTQAFESCVGLVDVIIPSTLERTGNAIFYKCSNLKNLTIEPGLANIGEQFCDQCTSLTSIVVPETVLKIGNSAFEGCTSLTSAVIGTNNKDYRQDIGGGCFRNCRALKTVDFKESVSTLGTGALQNCAAVEKVWLRNNNLTISGEQVFSGCEKLTSAGPIDHIVDGEKMDYNIEFAWDEKIPDYAFSGATVGTYYSSYLNSIVLPTSLRSIGAYAFRDTKRLTTIEIPATVHTIGEGAFYASGLSTVSIFAPIVEGTTMSLGNQAFAFCNSLSNAYLHFRKSLNTIADAQNSWWYGCPSTTKLYIPFNPSTEQTDIEIAYGAMWNVYERAQQPDGTFIIRYLEYTQLQNI